MTLRIDKWLYHTRFFKTRVLAGRAVTGGHVRVNGVRAKPATGVRPGDTIDLVKDQQRWRMTATELPVRRGPANEARQCYAEDEAVAQARQSQIESRKLDRLQMPRTEGRPDKRTRRMIRTGRRGN